MEEYTFMWQKSWRTPAANKAAFLATVKKGDILISKAGIFSGLIGHAALMATDNWVIEMPGVRSSSSSSSSSNEDYSDNNRRISKDSWFEEHKSGYNITVYRCKNNSIAIMAADWAYTHYYNPVLGAEEKTIHIRYEISPNFESRDSSYCSKLVIQAYYYGTGSAKVISNLGFLISHITAKTILPTDIPGYFTLAYSLIMKGIF